MTAPAAEPLTTSKRITNALTVGAYRAGSVAAQLTPGRVAQATAPMLGAGFAQAMRSRRSMIERHLRRVDPTLRGAALDRAVQGSFDSYARYWVESFRLPSLSGRTVDRGHDLTGYFDHLLPALDAGKGVILALPHLGGWEWAGRWMTERGHHMTVVVEPLANDELFEWFRELRSRLGMTVVPLGPSAAGEVVRALRANQVVCLLSDRDLQRNGVEVEFFGERTTLPGGPAMIALRTGAPILPVATYFTERYNGHHSIVRPPIDLSRTNSLRADVQRITQDLAHEFETLIRRAPEQWHLFQPNWPSDPGYDD